LAAQLSASAAPEVRHPPPRTAVNDARGDLRVAQQELNAAQQEADAAHRAAESAQQELDAADRVLAAGIPLPRVDHEPLVAARRAVALAEQRLTDAVRAQAEAERTLQACEAELAALDTQLGAAATSLGQHYPDAAWWDDRHRRELAALWTDVEWNQARSELFLAALALHKAFLRHTARDMRRNLQAAMDVVSGEAPGDAPDTAVLTAWQSLFFVVPVVSTTFASYARLFGHLGKEALGWLLIDEAGQATPQNAVGALWRTQRAVVVGDPLQLEPITTLPFRAEQAIRVEAEMDEQWLTSRTSVQRLADRLTRLGTWLPGDDDPAWVGVPLTVHRRCDQPMFDIVNTIAYDGLMIDGTGTSARERFNAAYPALPESMWIDVPGVGAQGHWIPAEGVQLDRILGRIASLEFDMSEVMVIGPFRDVARQVRRRCQRHPGLVAAPSTRPRASRPTSSLSCWAALPIGRAHATGRRVSRTCSTSRSAAPSAACTSSVTGGRGRAAATSRFWPPTCRTTSRSSRSDDVGSCELRLAVQFRRWRCSATVADGCCSCRASVMSSSSRASWSGVPGWAV
jgi:AAA domain-containing protein